jgi:Glycosyl transferase family 21/Leucine carboxyl methyltransferase
MVRSIGWRQAVSSSATRPSRSRVADPEIRHVSDTALWVAAFRAQEGRRPNAVFDDPLALILSGERGRAIARAIPRAAMVEWGMIIRTSAIDRLINEALVAGVDAVVNLIANQLADDYRLGELTRRAGLRTVLSDVVVETVVSEITFIQLVRHELRWLRTIRAVNPLGFRFLFLTFNLPIVALGSVLAEGSIATILMLASTTVARLLLHAKTRRPGLSRALALLLPLRDLLSLGLWVWSFVRRRVQWGDSHFHVARDGSARLVQRVQRMPV